MSHNLRTPVCQSRATYLTPAPLCSVWAAARMGSWFLCLQEEGRSGVLEDASTTHAAGVRLVQLSCLTWWRVSAPHVLTPEA